MAVPSPANLQRLAGLLETGALRVSIQRTYRLDQAGEALQALPSTHTQGTFALTIARTARLAATDTSSGSPDS